MAIAGLRDFVEVQKTRAMFLCKVDVIPEQFAEVINVISTMALIDARSACCQEPEPALSVTFVNSILNKQ
jgi:hypothetical protein